MATIKRHEDSPFKIWMAVAGLAGAVFKGITAHKTMKKAEGLETEAREARNDYRNKLNNMTMTNPFEGMKNQFEGMENKMEDLTVNQKEAEFASQQLAQSQSNIMSGLRGAAGGSGIAALAQQLAQQGQIAAQKSAAGIGQQEAANQAKMAQEASNIQIRERQGAADVANKIAAGEQQAQMQNLQKTQALLADASAEYQHYQKQAAEATAMKNEAIGQAIPQAIPLVGKIGQALGLSDRRFKKNIKLIGKSPSGLNIYAFEYINKLFGEGTYQGVMSDEVPTTAVINNGDYDIVDYSKLDVEFKQI